MAQIGVWISWRRAMAIEDRLRHYFSEAGSEFGVPASNLRTIVAAARRRSGRSRLLAAASVAIAGPIVVLAIRDGDSAQPQAGIESEAEPDRVVVTPFAEVANRLLDQADLALFTVTSSEPRYWRIATLDTFRNGLWVVTGTYRPVDDERFTTFAAENNRVVRQTITVSELDTIWLPAAGEPVQVPTGAEALTDADLGVGVEVDLGGGTLAVSIDSPSSNGVVYSVLSTSPTLTADQLRSATDADPPSITQRYLGADDDPYAPGVDQSARRIVEGQATRYDRVRAVQDHLRSGAFDEDAFDEDALDGSPSSPQLAGTMTAMLRALGIPARVAVGFTWGEPTEQAAAPDLNNPDPNNPGLNNPADATTYVVSGRHAHVWPEAYFEPFGWVPFEPTPGRGQPGAAAYTGVEPAQATVSPADE